MTSQPTLLVIGSSNLDHCLNVARFPLPGETVNSRDYFQAYGGKGANQAVAAARLGIHTRFATTLGDDAPGSAMRDYFSTQGIDTENVFCLAGEQTGMAMIMIDGQGENQIVLHRGANTALNADFVRTRLSEVIAACDALLLQLEIPLDGVLAAAEIARRHNRPVFLNPAPYCDLPEHLLRLVDTITPNETETEALTGIRPTDPVSRQAACVVLQQKGIPNVLLTLGETGVYAGSGDGLQFYPAFSVDARDTTGAGDTFNGAYFAARLRGAALPEAVRFAQAAAALAVQTPGAQTSVPTLAETESFLHAQQYD